MVVKNRNFPKLSTHKRHRAHTGRLVFHRSRAICRIFTYFFLRWWVRMSTLFFPSISRQKNGTAEDCRPRIAQKHSGEKQQIAPRASALLWKLTKMPLKNASYQNAPRGMDNKKILRKYGIKKMLQNIFRARSKGSAPLGELFFSLESALRPARCRIRWFWGVQLASGALHFKTFNKK